MVTFLFRWSLDDVAIVSSDCFFFRSFFRSFVFSGCSVCLCLFGDESLWCKYCRLSTDDNDNVVMDGEEKKKRNVHWSFDSKVSCFSLNDPCFKFLWQMTYHRPPYHLFILLFFSFGVCVTVLWQQSRASENENVMLLVTICKQWNAIQLLCNSSSLGHLNNSPWVHSKL